MHKLAKQTAMLVVILLLHGALANTEAYGVQEDVVYGFAYGAPQSAYASMGPDFAAESLVPIDGCAYSIIREDAQRGRARAQAFFGGATVIMDFSNTTNILIDASVDGREDHGGEQYPRVQAEMAMYGDATIEVDGQPYIDPVTGDAEFKTSYVVTPTGYRHEGVAFADDGGMYSLGEPALLREEWEIQMRIEGAEGTTETSFQVTQPSDQLIPGRFTLNANYEDTYTFPNQHFDGEGLLDVSFTSEALEGLNELTFRVRAPNGDVVANTTVTAALGNDGQDSKTFPLDQFGNYMVDVSGSVALSQYDFTFTQSSNAPFDLWMWWENVTVGVDAWYQFADCNEYVGEPNAVVASDVGRPPPPGLNLTVIALAIVGTVIVLMTASRLFGQTVTAARFKKTFKR